MKSYTDIEQSKKLAEILPLESADMFLAMNGTLPVMSKYIDDGLVTADETAVPCWSLGALLEFLPKIVNNETLFIKTSATLWHVGYRNVHTAIETYLIDACYELIIKLKTLNLL